MKVKEIDIDTGKIKVQVGDLEKKSRISNFKVVLPLRLNLNRIFKKFSWEIWTDLFWLVTFDTKGLSLKSMLTSFKSV